MSEHSKQPRSQRYRCFAQLGLASTATVDQVTEAYRRLAASQHPDVGGDSAQFNELEKAYRECLKVAQARPRISGRPSRDHFSPGFPDRRPAWLHYSSLAVIAIFSCVVAYNTRLGLLAAAVVGPLLLGGLLSQLRKGQSLFLGAVCLLALGLGWLAAAYHINWIAYAFDMVPPAAGGTEFVPAVDPKKQFWLVVAMATTVFLAVMVVIGCLVSVTKSHK